MGRMKDLFIDEMNKNLQQEDTGPEYDGAGFTIADREPPYIAKQFDGKKLWIVKSIKDDCQYKLWAHTYKEAVEMLPMIESF